MIEVHYLDIEPGMEEKQTFFAENVQNISHPDKLCQLGNEGLFATCELFGWPLNGTRKLLSQEDKIPLWSTCLSGKKSGFLGAGALGLFTLDSRDTTLETPPFVELRVSGGCTVPGITFVFCPEENRWCQKAELTLYRGETPVLQQTVYPDSPRWIFPTKDVGFDRLTVRLLETNTPGCYGKLHRLYLGQALVYSHEALESVHLINEADPTLDALTVDTMTLEIRELQQRELSPRQDQKMELYRDGKLLASHRIESCTRQEKHRYTFRCRSLVGQLEATFYGGVYDAVPLPELLAQVLGGVEFSVDKTLETATLTGYLPVCTRRQALQQIAFAVGGLVSTQGTRGIRLCPLEQQISASFTADAQFRDGAVETVSGVSRLEAVAHQYTPIKERQTLINGEYFNGTDILLTFTEPHHSYELTGGTLLTQSANYIRFTAKGEVTVTACPYNHTTVRHSRGYTPTQGVSRNEVRKVEEATLIHSGNVEKLLDRLEATCALQQTLTQSVVVEGQYAGQQVALTDPFGGLLRGYITTMESELTPGGQTARITLIGRQTAPEIAVGYAGMLYAGQKEDCL